MSSRCGVPVTVSWLLCESGSMATSCVTRISISDRPFSSGVAPGANAPCDWSMWRPPARFALSKPREISIVSVLLTVATANWPGIGQNCDPLCPSLNRICSPTRKMLSGLSPLRSLICRVLVGAL